MDFEWETRMLACNIISNVCEYYLRTLHNERKGYMNPTASLYSKFGHFTIVDFLENKSVHFYAHLKRKINFQLLNKTVFGAVVSDIVEEYKYNHLSHSQFYITCAKIAILGIFFTDKGFFPKDTVNQEIKKLAMSTIKFGYLHQDYDEAKRYAQTIVYVVFRRNGLDLTYFTTRVQQMVGWDELKRIPPNVLNYLDVRGTEMLAYWSNNDHFLEMDANKFNCLVQIFLESYEKDLTFSFFTFLKLQCKVALLSLHSVKYNFKDGIEMAFDTICKNFLAAITNDYTIRVFV